MNLSETAFLTERNNDFASADTFGLRWLTPTAESRLCGHATLASCKALRASCVSYLCLCLLCSPIAHAGTDELPDTQKLAGGNTSTLFHFDTVYSGCLEAELMDEDRFNMTLPLSACSADHVPDGVRQRVIQVNLISSCMPHCRYGAGTLSSAIVLWQLTMPQELSGRC